MLDATFSGITLTKDPYKESGDFVSIYTQEFGKISVLSQGSRKITSKLGSHLEPLRLIRGRIIEKTVPRITDAITENAFSRIRSIHTLHERVLEILKHIKNNTGEFQRDTNLWLALISSLDILSRIPPADIQRAALIHDMSTQANDTIQKALGYQ